MKKTKAKTGKKIVASKKEVDDMMMVDDKAHPMMQGKMNKKNAK